MFNARYKAWLIEYAEGTLDDYRRSLLEARLAVDPQLAAEADLLRRTVTLLQRSADENRPVELTRDYWPSIQARLGSPQRPVIFTPMRLAWASGSLSAAAVAVVIIAAPWHTSGQATNPHSTMVAENSIGTIAPSLAPSGILYDITKSNANSHVNIKRSPAISSRIANATHRSAKTIHMAAIQKHKIALGSPPSSIAHKTLLSNSKMLATRDDHSQIDESDTRTTFNEMMKDKAPNAAGFDQTASGLSSPYQEVEHPSVTFTGSGGFPGNMLPQRSSSFGHMYAPSESGGSSYKAAQPRMFQSKPVEFNSTNSGILSVAQSIRALRANAKRYLAKRDTPNALEMWRDMLLIYLTPPVYGDSASVDQTQQALVDIRSRGFLPDFRGKIERQQLSQPDDVVGARVLGFTYALQGEYSLARDKWRRVVSSSDACGEDWFQLGQAEDQLSHATEAHDAYLRATEPDGLPQGSPHRAIAETWLQKQ